MNHSNPANNPNKMNRKPAQTANPNSFIDENQPCIRNDMNMKTNFSLANSPNQIPINPGNTNTNNNQASQNRNETSTPNKQPASSSNMKKILKDNLILVLTIAGILGGIALGVVGRLSKPRPEVLILLSFPGELLLRILKMLILPLIISSLISGLAQLDPKSSGKMGSRAMGFYVMTTVIATITGILVALIVHPGTPDANKVNRIRKAPNPDEVQLSTLDAMLDIIRNMFPENIVQACSQQVGTSYKRVKKPKQVAAPPIVVNSTTVAPFKIPNQASIVDSVSSTTPATLVTAAAEELYEWVTVRELKYTDGTNVMGLVVFCIIFGIFISHSKSEAQIMFDFFFVLNELIMKVVALIMWYSPVGILFLVATNIIKIDNMAETARRLSYYMMTVILGLIIHALGTIQLMYFLTTRKNPIKFLKGMLQAWLTAVGTASSSATLPITFRCLEENNKVDKRVTRFMLPLGATVNMDGTALYQCVATLFIAQINGIDLSFGQLVAVCLSATATSIGVASIPSAALVTMIIVLSTVGLPTEDISYIVAVDWLLDRLRTSINVLGDAYGCGIVAHFSRHELRKLDEEAECEFAQIISASSPAPIMVAPNSHLGQYAYGDEQNFFPNPNGQNPIISVCDETSNINNQGFSNNDVNNNNSGNMMSPPGGNRGIPLSESINLQQQFNEFRKFDRRSSKQSQQSPAIPNVVVDAPAPSVVVMDAVRRRSRVLLFSSKIPASVKSMPQIANYASANVNVNAVNQDSNV